MKPKLELNLIPTTHGGPERYHPAIRTPEFDIWYWPNVTLPTESEAYMWASDVIFELTYAYLKQMQATVNDWNIHQT